MVTVNTSKKYYFLPRETFLERSVTNHYCTGGHEEFFSCRPEQAFTLPSEI